MYVRILVLGNIMANFSRIFPNPQKIAPSDLELFLNHSFDTEGTDVEPCTPSDWSVNPPKFALIKDRNYRAFARALNQIWNSTLCKEVARTTNSSIV